MNLLDAAVLLLLVAAAARGWRRGLLGQVFELGGGFLGLVVGVAVGPRVASMLTEGPGLEGVLISLVAVFLCLTVGQTIGYVVGHRFGSAARKARLQSVDAGLGTGFGIAVTLLAFWIVGSLLVGGPSREVARAFRGSAVLRAMNGVLPKPPDVLSYLRHYLDTSGFPQVFVGLPRPASPPVDLPSDQEARRAIRAADQSTMRIVVPACGGTQLGSGWVVADDVVVTNAHVVAGGEDVTVQDQSGNSFRGRVVVFEPQTDVAVVRTEGLGAPPLDLDVTPHDRGTPGATLGFPGARGGEMVVHRAAVQDRYNALGRDIYGRGTVSREVYELRSPVRQGDSGGPFVLPSGAVAGVVFAASTTDGEIGYALTGREVEDEIQEGIDSSDPVSTGDCTR